MPETELTSLPEPWKTCNPWIAGILAYLIPGAGHLYQRRWFKAVLYSVCILGVFFGGHHLGDWVVVSKPPEHRMTISYLGQLFVGLAAWPAMIQSVRVVAPGNESVRDIKSAMEADFRGHLQAVGPGSKDRSGPAIGRLSLEAKAGRFGAETGGRFVGTVNGVAAEYEVQGELSLDRPISGAWGREIQCSLATEGEHPDMRLSLHGTIPRRFWDAWQAPPSSQELQNLHGKLGKQYELALMFTWVAGLLNILAVWDAISGPAYGQGVELVGQDAAPGAGSDVPQADADSTPRNSNTANAV